MNTTYIPVLIIITVIVWELVKNRYKRLASRRKDPETGRVYHEVPLGSMYVQSTVLRAIADDIEKMYPGKTTVKSNIFVVKLQTMDILGIDIPKMTPKEQVKKDVKDEKEK